MTLLFAGAALAQPAPVPGAGIVPAPAPPPASAPPPGAATAISGVTPQFVDKPPPALVKGHKEGWITRVSTAATGSFANNSNVVGQVDGTSFAFGFKFDGTLDYNHEKHEWRNAVGALGAITKTPVIDAFVKSSDSLALDSTYLYHALKIFGPFARFSINTSMFRGTDERALPSHYVITHTDGTVERLTATELPMSDPFRPATFKESVGVFLQPYESEPVTVELRGGLGGQEVLADGQYALTPPSAPNPMAPVDPLEVDVTQLSNVNQLGAEVALSLWGSFVAKKVTYKINADAMTPFAHSALAAGDTRGPFALTNVQVDAALSFHLVDWASIDYQLKAIRQPQVLDELQVQNTLLLTFGLTYSNAPPPPPASAPPPPPASK